MPISGLIKYTLRLISCHFRVTSLSNRSQADYIFESVGYLFARELALLDLMTLSLKFHTNRLHHKRILIRSKRNTSYAVITLSCFKIAKNISNERQLASSVLKPQQVIHWRQLVTCKHFFWDSSNRWACFKNSNS